MPSDDEIDDAVAEWHNSGEEDTGLLEYLASEFGWTIEEARSWVETGEVPYRE